MSQKNLKTVLKRICELQPSYTSENTPAMQERGKLIRHSLTSEIKLVKSTPPTASGGKLEMMIGWDIDEWLATPTAFRVERRT
ncbi:hypothetical protein OAC37_02630 [Amylibacter sp.]|nr:hypothetical protein [Amylibacter sp.]